MAAGGLVVGLEETRPRLVVRVGPARAPPGSVGTRMRLTLGPRTYDLRSRALVMGTLGTVEELVGQGADLVELASLDRQPAMPVPACVTASDEAAVGRALAAGASLVHLPQPTPAGLRMCAAAGVAVLVPPGAAGDAAGAGVFRERIVPESLLLDVTAVTCPMAATAVGVIQGARIVRAPVADIRGARRVVDVLAAVMEAR